MVIDEAVKTLKATVEDLRQHGEAQRAEAIEAVLMENERLRENLNLIRQLSENSEVHERVVGETPTYVPSVVTQHNRRLKELPPALDLLTSTEIGNLVGVTGQTIKNWVKEGRMEAYRIGNRIMVPREVVEEYVRSAGESLDLDDCSPEEAARLVDEARGKSE